MSTSYFDAKTRVPGFAAYTHDFIILHQLLKLKGFSGASAKQERLQ